MSVLPSPSENSSFRKYLSDVVAWHGYVRFLGLPSYQNNPDVPLDELYVSHTLSGTYLSPDTDPRSWKTFDPVKRLLTSQRLVVLGDPGSGKSTLVNWLAWYMSSGFSRKLPGKLADLLPLPLVIRDLVLTGVDSFDGLIAAFLGRPVAKELNIYKDQLYEYLRAGQVLLLVDGLDEIGVEGRKQIRDALQECLFKYPDVFVFCTSRIVGYEDAPIGGGGRQNDSLAESDKAELIENASTEPKIGRRKNSNVDLYYMAPFSDAQIATFALNWYREQEGTDSSARLLRDDFFAAIRSNESTLRLARTPNLLTMMALIYRIRARLPSGRALLYEDIAQAYLESIDTARKLKDEFSWLSKKRWLARVGFEMQFRRSSTDSGERADQELLIKRSDILQWVSDAIVQSGEYVAEGYAEKYLDWITRRSGLLLPRGEGLFAFLHLSFQEYFAALYVKQQMEHPAWFSSVFDDDNDLDKRVTQSMVREWAGEPVWHQTCIFLFELCAEKPGWPKQLTQIFFPVDWSSPAECWEKQSATEKRSHLRVQGQFCLQILGNSHGGLTQSLRTTLLSELRRLAWHEQKWLGPRIETERYFYRNTVLIEALNTASLKSEALAWIHDLTTDIDSLILDNLSAEVWLELIPAIRSLSWLKNLSLCQIKEFSFEQLPPLENLETLCVDGTGVRDLHFVASCHKLKNFTADNTDLDDLTPLRSLKELRHLSLTSTKVTDLIPLQGLKQIEHFSLMNTSVSNISALKNMSKLKLLFLGGESISDFSALGELTQLRYLFLSKVSIRSLKILTRCTELLYLSVTESPLVNISAVRGMPNLQSLNFDRTQVRDLSAVAFLKKLNYLSLDDTRVSDLAPLSTVEGLEVIYINRTKVTSLVPLQGLPNLQSVSVSNTPIHDDFLPTNPKLTISGLSSNRIATQP